MAFSQASVSSFASQEDPLGLFPEQHIEESLAEPAQEMLCIQDLPPASQAGQEEASVPSAQVSGGGRTKARRASPASSPLHVLIPDDAVGGMETLFADTLPGPSYDVFHNSTGIP